MMADVDLGAFLSGGSIRR
nr:hypothetical protein [Haloarcula sp. CBA1131]